jgi:NADPH:quinone reductase-like Zn-dependent oxidoreductase
MLRLFAQVRDLMRAGVLTSEVGATYALDDVAKAAAEAWRPGHHGKVLLRLGR